jgi:hypothetical protein
MMSSSRLSVLGLCLCAGSLFAADEQPMVIEPGYGRVVNVAHIYYNIATGERVVTLVDGRGRALVNVRNDADTVDSLGMSGPIWSVLGGAPCPGDSGTNSIFYIADDNSPGGTSLSTGAETLDFGDIELDSVVDMVHINWITGHRDDDSNSDGIGDGVPGLGGRWTYWDAENGRMTNSCTRLPLVSILFSDLPGNVNEDGFLSGYTADIDLAGAFSGSSLTFEIGDSDGDLQGAAFGNSDVDSNSDGIGDGPIATLDRDLDGLPDSDLDGDGLFDWGWSVRFFQPGTADLDSDGVIDGDLADSEEPIGLSLGLPAGVWVDQGDGTWNWEMGPVTPDDYGYGAEDRMLIFLEGVPVSSVSFGGPQCGPIGYTPMAQLATQLIGPLGSGSVCTADLDGDGDVDFFDVSIFVSAFSALDPLGDFDHDGDWDFFDVSSFVAAFAAGCPD